MIRFVADPSGTLVADLAGTLPGRGAWVSATGDALRLALDKRLFQRSMRRPVRHPDDLAAQTEALLARQCMNLLGLARRAGNLVTGFEKVRAALAAGEIAVVVAARDGAGDGRRKIEAAAAHCSRPVLLAEALSGAELSLALGRENVVHAALRPGGLAERFVVETRRLCGFRTGSVCRAAGSGRQRAGSV